MAADSHYFALSALDQDWGLHILNCGTIRRSPLARGDPEKHPIPYQLRWTGGRVLQEYQLIYLISGRGWFESRPSGLLPLESGNVVLLYPRVWHRYKPEEGSQWHTYWVGFGGTFAAKLVKNLRLTPEQPIRMVGHREELLTCFSEILKTGREELPGYQQVLAGEVMKLIGLVYALPRRKELPRADADRLIAAAKARLIRHQPGDTIEQVARELAIGYASFRKLFKAYTGLSPGQFRMQHRIARARHLLHHSTLSVKEIAFATGFDTLSYFTRIFRKKTGKTPREYRKQFRSDT